MNAALSPRSPVERFPCSCDECVAHRNKPSEQKTVEDLTTEIARLIAENAELRAERTRHLIELNDKRTAFGSIGGGDTALGGES